MSNLKCPICPPELESNLNLLPKTHPEYYQSLQTNDGTRKWFFCEKCDCVFCRDKVTATWQYSPKTYDTLLEKKLINNRLLTND